MFPRRDWRSVCWLEFEKLNIETPVRPGSESFAQRSHHGTVRRRAPRVFALRPRADRVDGAQRGPRGAGTLHSIRVRPGCKAWSEIATGCWKWWRRNESISTILERSGVPGGGAMSPRSASLAAAVGRTRCSTWATAPAFPAEGLRLLKPFRVLRTPLVGSGRSGARDGVLGRCPRILVLGGNRRHLAGQLGIESCRSTPVSSADGMLLGMLALHYKAGHLGDESDAELL